MGDVILDPGEHDERPPFPEWLLASLRGLGFAFDGKMPRTPWRVDWLVDGRLSVTQWDREEDALPQ